MEAFKQEWYWIPILLWMIDWAVLTVILLRLKCQKPIQQVWGITEMLKFPVWMHMALEITASQNNKIVSSFSYSVFINKQVWRVEINSCQHV